MPAPTPSSSPTEDLPVPGDSLQLITGNDCGLIQCVRLKDRAVVQSCGSIQQNAGITQLIHGPEQWQTNEQEYVFAGSQSGRISLWNPQRQQQLRSFNYHAGQKLVGLAVHNDGKLISAAQDGTVVVNPLPAELAEWSAVSKIKKLRLTIPDKQQLSVMQLQPATSGEPHIALGGIEYHLRLLNLQTNTEVWRERNVDRDELDLRVPIHINAIAFNPTNAEHLLATGTSTIPYDTRSKRSRLRLYDIRTQNRQPTADIVWSDHAVTHLQYTIDGKYIVAGDSAGLLQLCDVRKTKPFAVLRGTAGSIRGIACCTHSHLLEADPALQSMVASVGLDRHLRLYDYDSRTLLHKVYLKHKLNAVLFSRLSVKPAAKDGVTAKTEDEEEEDDGRDVFDVLEEKSRRNKAKKQKRSIRQQRDDED